MQLKCGNTRLTERGSATMEAGLIMALIAMVALVGISRLGRTIAYSEETSVDDATVAMGGEAPAEGGEDLGEEVTINSSSGSVVTSGNAPRSNPVFNHAAAAVQAPDVADSGFEDGSTRVWTNYEAGETIGAWTVVEGNVDTHDTVRYQFGQDRRAIDLNGFNPGAIEQTIGVIPGVGYTLTLDVSENQCGPASKDMGIDWNGERISTVTVDLPKGEYRTYQVQLPPSTTDKGTLTLRGLNGANCGVQVDEPSIALDPT